jgi:hypothetical protein
LSNLFYWVHVSLRASQAGQKTASISHTFSKYHHIFFILRLLAVLTSEMDFWGNINPSHHWLLFLNLVPSLTLKFFTVPHEIYMYIGFNFPYHMYPTVKILLELVDSASRGFSDSRPPQNHNNQDQIKLPLINQKHSTFPTFPTNQCHWCH